MYAILLDEVTYATFGDYSEAEAFVYRHQLYKSGAVVIVAEDGARYCGSW